MNLDQEVLSEEITQSIAEAFEENQDAVTTYLEHSLNRQKIYLMVIEGSVPEASLCPISADNRYTVGVVPKEAAEKIAAEYGAPNGPWNLEFSQFAVVVFLRSKRIFAVRVMMDVYMPLQHIGQS